MPPGGFRSPFVMGRVPVLPALGAGISAFMVWHTGMTAMLLALALVGGGALVTFVWPQSLQVEAGE
jgi:hypothetical protein